MTGSDDYRLERFVQAQEPVFDAVRQELKAGHKRSHWMWFVFPQLQALGRSSMAEFYGIASLAEARAYFSHDLLGPRLVGATELVLAHRDQPLQDIFGAPDDRKFCSCMTLFSMVCGNEKLFDAALDCFCDGRRDERTLLLAGAQKTDDRRDRNRQG
ncbi:MAG: DUF1810 domain-containing protein [Phyllobacterium sp.]